MNKLTITDDGKLSVNDYKSLSRAILSALANEKEGLRTIDLVRKVRKTVDEFRFVNERIFAQTISDLQHQGMIDTTYTPDFIYIIERVEDNG